MSTKTITISGEKFEVGAPYTEGHVINAMEAKVLNQTRAENIGNNFRADVKKALESGNPAELEAVRLALAEYDSQYVFSMTTTRTPVDPIEAEAEKIAKSTLHKIIKQKYGITIKQYLENEENRIKYAANIERLSQQEDTLAEAKKIVNARNKKKPIDTTAADI